MMNKNTMTDEDTIKALKSCACWENDETCDECPANTYDFNCTNRMAKSALNLANRYEAKIEELRSDKIIAERREKDARELFVDCTMQLKEAKAEIERLKRGVTFTFTIEDFESIKETIISSLDNKIKSEAIKEFAERLCKRKVENDPVVIAAKAELKEMEAENNGNN